MHFSAAALLKHALTGNRWPRQWRAAEPKRRYDAIVVGGGGHGLATGYYLAKVHGMTDVAVIERGWIGGGNVGRNTTIVRSNYLLPENARFYELSMALWESLSKDLNYNVMFSQRGVMNLAHTPSQLDAYARRGNAMRLLGIDADLLSREEVEARVPHLDVSPEARFPVVGALVQPRGGTARHDAVAWGFARAASRLGVDIIEQCEVTGFVEEGGRVRGVETSRGTIRADKVGVAVAGSTSEVMRRAGVGGLPIESHALQAFVSEPLKPVLDTVVTFGAGHLYVSQSDKGGLVFGGDLDMMNSYAQRGNTAVMRDVAGLLTAMFPNLGRVRLLRHWGGIMDMSMDGSPIIAVGPKPGLFLNAGWCYGGFKATPASGYTFAHTIATGTPHDVNAPFTLERFCEGRVLDEKGVGPHPWLH